MKTKERLKLLKKCKKQLKKIAECERDIKENIIFIKQEEEKHYSFVVTKKVYYESQINHFKLDISIAEEKYNEILQKLTGVALECDCGNIYNVKVIPICANCYNPHTGEW